MERLGVLVGCLESILGVFAASWARLGASSWDPLSPSWPVSEWAGAVSGALGAHPQPVYFWLWMGRFFDGGGGGDYDAGGGARGDRR